MGGRDSMSTATNKWPVYMCKQVNNILKNKKKNFKYRICIGENITKKFQVQKLLFIISMTGG